MNERGDALARLEAVLFASKRGLSLDEMTEMLDADSEEIKQMLRALEERYSRPDHGIELRKFGNRWRFYVKPSYVEYASKVQRMHPRRLSPTHLEVLAAILVKGEATRSEVERMRRRNSSKQLQELVKLRFLVRRRKGRTYVYRLARGFYEYFQTEDISELLSDG